jgi:hypothetical protein
MSGIISNASAAEKAWAGTEHYVRVASSDDPWGD